MTDSVWHNLSRFDVSKEVETKDRFDYLSWAWTELDSTLLRHFVVVPRTRVVQHQPFGRTRGGASTHFCRFRVLGAWYGCGTSGGGTSFG